MLNLRLLVPLDGRSPLGESQVDGWDLLFLRFRSACDSTMPMMGRFVCQADFRHSIQIYAGLNNDYMDSSPGTLSYTCTQTHTHTP